MEKSFLTKKQKRNLILSIIFLSSMFLVPLLNAQGVEKVILYENNELVPLEKPKSALDTLSREKGVSLEDMKTLLESGKDSLLISTSKEHHVFFEKGTFCKIDSTSEKYLTKEGRYYFYLNTPKSGKVKFPKASKVLSIMIYFILFVYLLIIIFPVKFAKTKFGEINILEFLQEIKLPILIIFLCIIVGAWISYLMVSFLGILIAISIVSVIALCIAYYILFFEDGWIIFLFILLIIIWIESVIGFFIISSIALLITPFIVLLIKKNN